MKTPVFAALPLTLAAILSAQTPAPNAAAGSAFGAAPAYEGNHTNRIPERFDTKLVPFFSENLSAQAKKK